VSIWEMFYEGVCWEIVIFCLSLCAVPVVVLWGLTWSTFRKICWMGRLEERRAFDAQETRKVG